MGGEEVLGKPCGSEFLHLRLHPEKLLGIVKTVETESQNPTENSHTWHADIHRRLRRGLRIGWILWLFVFNTVLIWAVLHALGIWLPEPSRFIGTAKDSSCLDAMRVMDKLCRQNMFYPPMEPTSATSEVSYDPKNVLITPDGKRIYSKCLAGGRYEIRCQPTSGRWYRCEPYCSHHGLYSLFQREMWWYMIVAFGWLEFLKWLFGALIGLSFFNRLLFSSCERPF